MLHLAEFGTRLQSALAGGKSWVERPHGKISWISFSSEKYFERGAEKARITYP